MNTIGTLPEPITFCSLQLRAKSAVIKFVLGQDAYEAVVVNYRTHGILAPKRLLVFPALELWITCLNYQMDVLKRDSYFFPVEIYNIIVLTMCYMIKTGNRLSPERKGKYISLALTAKLCMLRRN